MDLFDFAPPGDFRQAIELVQPRLDPLAKLITAAYADEDGEAWRQYQLGLSRLHTRYPSPFQEDIATTALRRHVYDVEDRVLPYAELPPGADTVDSYIAILPKILAETTSIQTPLVRFLVEGKPTRDQWKLYAASMYARGAVHHRNLSRCALNTHEERDACFIYRMLGDEGGQGDYEQAHSTLVLPFLHHLGGGDADVASMQQLFEAKVVGNWTARCFMNKNPVWSAATICYLENQAGAEFTAVLPRVRAAGIPEEVLRFFVVHGEDPEVQLHNDMCVQLLRRAIKSNDDLRIAHTAIKRAGTVFDRLFAKVGERIGIAA